MPSLARCLRPLLGAIAVLLVSGACGDDDDSTKVTPLPPASVEIVDLSGAGAFGELELGSPLPIACDLTLSVMVGAPKNFPLRPPHACGSVQQCGYIQFALLDASGSELASVEAASTVGVIPLAGVALGDAARVVVTLIQASDSEPVSSEEGQPVSDEVAVTLLAPEDCTDGSGGAGGAGGQAGSGAGETAGGASAAGGTAGLGGANSGGESGSAGGSAGATGEGGTAGAGS